MVQYAELPKASQLALTVLEDDNEVHDWKALLEAQMQSAYTTLTKGDTLVIPDPTNSQHFFQCLVTDLKPADAVCIVDTDIDLDIITPARPQSSSKSDTIDNTPIELKAGGAPALIKQLSRAQNQTILLKSWNADQPLTISLESLEKETAAGINLFVGVSEYATSPNAFLWSTIMSSGTKEKTITITPSDPYLFINDKITSEIVICVHAEEETYTNIVVSTTQNQDVEMADAAPILQGDSKECSNCHKFVPARSYQLHLTFCERNNIACPNGCGQLFLRLDGGVPESHWHCSECSDSVYGNTAESKQIHDLYAHTPVPTCLACHSSAGFSNRIALALHQATTCPNKFHICRFCHLKLPQETASPVDILEGYSGHESHCGSRTTDCPKCKRAVRMRELRSHMEYHNMERLANSKAPAICSNLNCVRTLASNTDSKATLGLCAICFGPLHSTVYDPTGAKLTQRLERRYLIQLTRGCGRAWCANTTACATASPVKLSMPQVMTRVQELLAGGSQRHLFCVDEMTTKRKTFVDFLAEGEQVYTREWIAKAIEQTKGNESAARGWLEDNAIKISEQKQE